MSNFIEALNWRAATKSFDSEKKLTTEQIQYLLEAFRLTASSYGLQLWKCVVVENNDLRARLRNHAWGQAQITDASHLLVLCRQTNIGTGHVDTYIDLVAQTKNIPAASLEGYANMMKGSITSKSQEDVANWAGKQVYIALGNLMAACAVAGIDSCPMEGFDPQKFNEELGLDEHNLAAQVLLPVGYRTEGSETAKVRYPLESVVLYR